MIIVVDNKQIADQKDPQQATHRDAYTSPRLKVFGPVGALTQGGSTGSKEDLSQGPPPYKP